MTAFSIHKQISIAAPPSVVFDALTDSEKIVQYYPLKEVRSTWQFGSEIILKGSNGNQDFTDFGTIEILLPHEKFQYSYWSDNHRTARVPENYLTICYTLHETDNSTNLELEHKNLKSETMYLQMLDVWDFLLSNLKKYAEQK
jgi:uncharacterized protein YndB with AHSA1/START domain